MSISEVANNERTERMQENMYRRYLDDFFGCRSQKALQKFRTPAYKGTDLEKCCNSCVK